MTPKIEKTEVQTICPLGETIPDFTQEIEKTGFSTPNCEICKDYPKEYWCGNPENKVSTPNEEIKREILYKVINRQQKFEDNPLNYSSEDVEYAIDLAFSLKEQENKDLDNVLAYWKKQAELSRAEKDKLLSSLQEKIEGLIKSSMSNGNAEWYIEELQKIFKEKGE